MHIEGIAAAAYSGTTKSSARIPTLLHHLLIVPTTAAHGYFAHLYSDQRPAIHNIICSAL